MGRFSLTGLAMTVALALGVGGANAAPLKPVAIDVGVQGAAQTVQLAQYYPPQGYRRPPPPPPRFGHRPPPPRFGHRPPPPRFGHRPPPPRFGFFPPPPRFVQPPVYYGCYTKNVRVLRYNRHGYPFYSVRRVRVCD